MFTAMSPSIPMFCEGQARPDQQSDNTLPSLKTIQFSSASSPFRPTISSPLSSSPIRATTPPPLSPRDPNARREVQSSPVPAPTPFWGTGCASSRPSSKFATRPARPVPVAQKREAAQESRRKLFLKNVRQRAEDKRWENRGGEQELLKLEWFSLNADLRQAKNAEYDGTIFESDIEDAARLREEVMSKPRALGAIPEASAGHEARPEGMDADDMMVDMFEQGEQAELEALVSSISEERSSLKPPDSPYGLDDDDYDALFMDYLSQQQQSSHQMASSGDMDLS